MPSENSTINKDETENCLFCKLSKNNDNIIYETDKVYVILDRFPTSSNHLLLIMKEHHALLHEYDDESLSELLVVTKKIIMKLNMKKYNLVQNNVNEQLIPHTHLHLIECNSTGGFKSIEGTKLNLNEKEYHEMSLNLKKQVN